MNYNYNCQKYKFKMYFRYMVLISAMVVQLFSFVSSQLWTYRKNVKVCSEIPQFTQPNQASVVFQSGEINKLDLGSAVNKFCKWAEFQYFVFY